MPNQWWTPGSHKAFDDLKDFLTKPLVLVAPNNEEPLLLHVITTTQVVSVAIVIERKEKGHI